SASATEPRLGNINVTITSNRMARVVLRRSWPGRPPRGVSGARRSASAGAQDHARDLERREHADRWSPVAAAARHVELRAVELVAPGEQAALLDPHDVVPRPDLAAVGVPRELQIDAVQRCAPGLARLMREQHERARPIAAGERARQVLAVPGIAVRDVVVDAGQLEARVAVADGDALVAQVARPEPRDLGDPRVGARIVLVVAGDGEHAVPRAQLAER